MTDEPAASEPDAWPGEQVPGPRSGFRSVSNIEPDLRVRAIVDRTYRTLVEDPTRDLVSVLREATEAVAPGTDRADWSALDMIAGKKKSVIVDSRDRVTDQAVRRLRLKYVDLGNATLRADEALRREASYQRDINGLAMEILRRARDVHPNDPILAERANYSSPVMQRIGSVAERLHIDFDVGTARSRAVDLLRAVAYEMGPAPKGMSWTEPLDHALRNVPDGRVAPERTVFNRAIAIAADENIRLCHILRELWPRPTLRDRVRMRITIRRSLPARVKMAPVAAHLQA